MPTPTPGPTPSPASGGPTFGAQLRQCRQAAGLSLRQLAGRIGHDHSYLAQIERGQRQGTADLARRCDGELGTGNLLTEAYRRTPAKPRRSTPTVGLDPLESAWQQLAIAFPEKDAFLAAEESVWFSSLQSLPAVRRLPELVRELSTPPINHRALQEDRQIELSLLIAETLTACGRLGDARRWWWAARQLADALGEPGLCSLARSREATSGLAEGRALPELLELTDEALTLALQEPRRSDAMLSARSTRARVLAALGRVVEAHALLPQLLSHADELPMASTGRGWAPYEMHGVEGRVCASLGYWTAGCLMFARGLELCPSERLEERALLELAMAECFAGSSQGAAALAVAMRVLIELPDEWHTTYVYAIAARVLSGVRQREPRLPGLYDLDLLVARRPWAGRSVGSESCWGHSRE
ncbi:helix-turn-helix domain-containing protein [Kribbella antibiotica]|uniref:helix-turn-helix domain-containing protein n=1 Tax=Kribbella antibiotica TaxID=190195 RepID=UPI003B5090DE